MPSPSAIRILPLQQSICERAFLLNYLFGCNSPNIQSVMTMNFRISMSITKEMFESQMLGVVKVRDDNLTCDLSYSVIDVTNFKQTFTLILDYFICRFLFDGEISLYIDR